MVVGYAALSATLSVNGTSTIASTTSFDVKFTGVTTTPTGRATSTHTTFENDTTLNNFSFGVILNQPGDKMVYNVTIKNIGTITPVTTPAYTHIDTNSNGIIEQGEQIKFGKYPQTKVTDTTLINTLNTKQELYQ